MTGYIDKINFHASEGRDVESGSVLFEIDPRPYEAEVARANANLLQAADASETRRARLRARAEDRRQPHDHPGAVRPGRRRSGRSQGPGRDHEGQSRPGASSNLNYTKVNAPISGRVSRTQLDQGNLVRADETVLATIVAMDPMYAYFELDERTLLSCAALSRKQGTISTPQRECTCRSRWHSPTKRLSARRHGQLLRQPARPRHRHAAGPGVFDNADRMLSPGMFVRVRLPIGQPYRALLVPEQALGTDQGQKFVYVVDDQNKRSTAACRWASSSGASASSWRASPRRSRGRQRIAARAARRRGESAAGRAKISPRLHRRSCQPGTAPAQAAAHKYRQSTSQASIMSLPALKPRGGDETEVAGRVFAILHRSTDLRLRAVDRDHAWPAASPCSVCRWRSFPPISPPNVSVQLHLSRRQRRGRGRQRGRADRAAGQRRRGHALHVVELHQRRHLQPDRHVPARHRPEHGPGAGAEPGQPGAARRCPT